MTDTKPVALVLGVLGSYIDPAASAAMHQHPAAYRDGGFGTVADLERNSLRSDGALRLAGPGCE